MTASHPAIVSEATAPSSPRTGVAPCARMAASLRSDLDSASNV
jgi:hypothetical protein